MNKFINIQGQLIDLKTPLVMGIMNITPDSFYAGSRIASEKQIMERAIQIMNEGGKIIDIGGQSTSLRSHMLSQNEEWERLWPALQIVRRELPDVCISVDTFYADVAQRAVEDFGVQIINDISGGQIDHKMFETVAGLQVPYILMHMRGTPQTMQQHTQYDHVVQDVMYYFSEKIAQLNALGVNDIILDPGFGFSKTLDQNYMLMQYLKYFDNFGVPILAGVSRKSMIYKLLGTSSEESLNGTTVLNTFALLSGASILRVHDVREAVECISITEKLKTKE